MVIKKLVIGIMLLAAAGGRAWCAGPDADDETKLWTWLHRRVFSAQEMVQNKKKQEIKSAKSGVAPFSQLVFSWNALRPKAGHFTFYVQVRDATTKRWGKWHRMADWGSSVQRSYLSESDGLSQHIHVRLELSCNNRADGFAIKIKSMQGADLALVHSFSVAVSDFTRFKSEVNDPSISLLPTVLVSGVPVFSQFELDHPRNDGLCSPTSTTMLTSFVFNKVIDPIEFAHKAFDVGLDKYGSWPFNTAHAFEHGGGDVHFSVARSNSFAGVHDYLRRGVPVVVSVRGALEGAPKVYNNGHLLIVVGYDAKTREVICHDPAAPTADKTVQRYGLKAFLSAWERSHRLAYLAHPSHAEAMVLI